MEVTGKVSIASNKFQGNANERNVDVVTNMGQGNAEFIGWTHKKESQRCYKFRSID